MKTLRLVPVFTFLVVLAFTLAIRTSSFAGDERDHIAGVGMARAFVATSKGLEAVGTNPANLTLPHGTNGVSYQAIADSSADSSATDSSAADSSRAHPRKVHYLAIRDTPPAATFAMPVLNLGLSAGSDIINYGIYSKYFTGVDSAGSRVSTFLDDGAKQQILSAFPNGFAITHLDFDIQDFGMTFHNDNLGDLALTVTERVAFRLDIPEDYVRFILYGLDSLGSNYNVSGTNFSGWWLREYAVTYARKIPQVKFLNDFSVGIGVKLIQGYAAIITDRYNATFGNTLNPDGSYTLHAAFDTRILRASSPNANGDSVKFSPFPTPAGSGLGLDIGANGELMKGIRVAASITDIGSVSWNKSTYETDVHSSITTSNPSAPGLSDSIENLTKGTNSPNSGFTTSLPTSLQLGASFQVDNLIYVPGQMLVSLEYQQGFNNVPGNTTLARVAAGTEWRLIPIMPWRTGISIGGVDRFEWSAGFGIDVGALVINVGTENIDILFSPNGFREASVGLGMIFRF
jgi:hypothetical protein